MTENNPTKYQLHKIWQKFFKMIKNFLTFLKKISQKISKKFPSILQIAQFTFVYLFTILSLFNSMIMLLGQIPSVFLYFIPVFFENILNSATLKFLLAPEKTYILYLFVIEFVIFNPIFKFSKLFQYNLLLIFLLEMSQNLFISYWDLFFHRELLNSVSSIDMELSIYCISVIYGWFLVLYVYSYFCAIRGKFTTFPFMDWLTDSVAFWLRLKTPTMGDRLKRKDKRK